VIFVSLFLPLLDFYQVGVENSGIEVVFANHTEVRQGNIELCSGASGYGPKHSNAEKDGKEGAPQRPLNRSGNCFHVLFVLGERKNFLARPTERSPQDRLALEKELPALVSARDKAVTTAKREQLQKETAQIPNHVAKMRR
jgi:hypothetical protein